MTSFHINEQNEIVAFATAEEAAATTATPFDSFTSQQAWGELAAAWPKERLVAIWNSLAGVRPVKRFANHKAAAGQVWARIQGLGQSNGAESGSQGQARGTGRQGCARDGEDLPEGHDGQEPAPGQKGRETAGCGRTARGQ